MRVFWKYILDVFSGSQWVYCELKLLHDSEGYLAQYGCLELVAEELCDSYYHELLGFLTTLSFLRYNNLWTILRIQLSVIWLNTFFMRIYTYITFSQWTIALCAGRAWLYGRKYDYLIHETPLKVRHLNESKKTNTKFTFNNLYIFALNSKEYPTPWSRYSFFDLLKQ